MRGLQRGRYPRAAGDRSVGAGLELSDRHVQLHCLGGTKLRAQVAFALLRPSTTASDDTSRTDVLALSRWRTVRIPYGQVVMSTILSVTVQGGPVTVLVGFFTASGTSRV